MTYYLRLLTFFLVCSNIKAQTTDLFCEQVQAINDIVKKAHYQPKPLDDDFASGVFNLFLLKLDERQRLFTETDIALFSKDSTLIDDYIKNENCDFINKYITTLESRISLSKSIIENLSNTALDYSGKDTLYFDFERPISYFKNEKEQVKYWNKRIRYEILSNIIEEDTTLANAKSHFKSLEKTLKPKIIQQQICILDELLNQSKGIDGFVKESFLNAFLNYQDPNSSFFNVSEKARFENSLSNDEMSFGIYTAKNKNGDIIITYIKPGSAAFKNGGFDKNDVIKSLKSKNKELETFCISNSEIIDFINDTNNATITFRIRKKNGTIKNIQLTKMKSQVESNTITGYVINNTIAKLGYIKIPSFYTDLESPNGLGVANDVAKELYKLQKEGIQGLIIDLRFNSGGSMKEATDLSGMFINRGPLAIQKYNSNQTFTIKDANRGSLFNKPLLVLINSYSASASEFFSAAMQDYNRAILVGSPSFGKATAQIILPLNDTETLGYAKVTIEKFYRATGKSHQLQGVIPDVVLPSIYDDFNHGESQKSYALSNDSITPMLKLYPLKPLPIKQINTQSKERRQQKNSFESVKDLNKTLLKNVVNKKTQFSLTLENLFNDYKTYKSTWDAFDNLSLKNDTIPFQNTASTSEIISYNTDEKKQNQSILNNLSKDIYINEAQNILIDIINLTNNN
ncbi:carboxy terminal-processing peptidase [Corallibacter vietnamensis]|uniref:Carboxy terminal-processing peptidase n=1 Tax=Corallibacter vietnamensis TaxID=904130 RepID=A0ABP7HG09_9FLAO